MYCSHCGAKLADDAKFCNECGAKLASPASPPVPSASPATPPVSPAAPPVSAAAQTGFPQGSYPPPQGGYPQGQPGYPAPGAAQPYPYAGQAAPPKKKHTALIVILVLLALIPIAFILLFVMLRLRYEEPPLPVPEATTVEAFVSETAEPSADATTAVASPSGETTAPAVTDAPQDAALSDAQARQVLERLCGFWNNEDNTQFIQISQVDGGFYFTSGYWYSEADMVGYLQGPVTGDPTGKITLRLYYEGYESDSYPMPAQDGEIVFDLSLADAYILTWEYGGFSQQVHFAGDTMEQALPPIS